MFHFPCCGSRCGSSLVLLLRERCFFVFTCALTFCTDDFHARFFAAAIPNTTTLDRTDLFQVELTAFLFLFFFVEIPVGEPHYAAIVTDQNKKKPIRLWPGLSSVLAIRNSALQLIGQPERLPYLATPRTLIVVRYQLTTLLCFK